MHCAPGSWCSRATTTAGPARVQKPAHPGGYPHCSGANAARAMRPSHLRRWPPRTDAAGPAHPTTPPDCPGGAPRTAGRPPVHGGPPPSVQAANAGRRDPIGMRQFAHWAHSRGPRQTRKRSAQQGALRAWPPACWHGLQAYRRAWESGRALPPARRCRATTRR